MLKILSRKLFGKNLKKLFSSLLVSVFIYFSLSQIGYKVEVSSQVLIITNIFFSGTIILQFLGSKNNGAYLKGFFAMPFNRKKFIVDYAVIIGLYVLATKALLIYAIILAFTEINLLEIIIILSSFIFVCLSAMIIYAFFKDKKIISAIVLIIGIATCILKSPVCIIVHLVISAIYAVTLFFVDPYRFMVTSRSKNKSKPLKKVRGGSLLVAKYIFRYIVSNKSHIISPVVLLAFTSYMVYMSTDTGFNDFILIGLVLVTFNTPLAVVVSSSKGLHKKLSSMPNKIKSFFIPYGVVVFIINIIFSALLIAITSFIGTPITVKAIVAALILPIQNAIGTVYLECKHPVLNWRVETDLWHNPRKYIIPAILISEATAMMMI